MTPISKLLTNFMSRSEILLAYRDALQAHRELDEKAGILHRDIKPSNILIVDTEDGPTGVLIDFDHSTQIADTTSPWAARREVLDTEGYTDPVPLEVYDELISHVSDTIALVEEETMVSKAAVKAPRLLKPTPYSRLYTTLAANRSLRQGKKRYKSQNLRTIYAL
ncbi:hypothetical protein M422DRAFT_261136 [Sphaerobolus stellatus SS14]|uniref:Protein kinase domain-containing protein n=1 Tax=Sphaerobolus stellatus (strain SS14) TaxID=990650 RepID=A0A0C9V3U6_SPHS4|nr:hypothetical protein M422DRAFT_261136 [Sphaerobolus stellatus SS14]